MVAMDTETTWSLTHRERAAVADQLEGLTPDQWEAQSLCGGWSVHVAAAHILAGAEQTRWNFLKRMAANGFRFNTMIDRDAHRAGRLGRDEIVRRLRSRTTTTNGPPAPPGTMLGEIVVHGEDIRLPLGIASTTPPEAVAACLELYSKASFPVGTKGRIQGLHLVASDVGWSHGSGPDVTGPGMALLVAMTGRRGSLDRLGGEGLATLTSRMPPAA
jgi:uncharacterized protein (TIGR03083 family)